MSRDLFLLLVCVGLIVYIVIIEYMHKKKRETVFKMYIEALSRQKDLGILIGDIYRKIGEDEFNKTEAIEEMEALIELFQGIYRMYVFLASADCEVELNDVLAEVHRKSSMTQSETGEEK